MDRVTLTQAAKALGVPQHRLIHLCEKGVVVPDIDAARGRGSSRGFSRKNLFEFAVALEMRRLELPLSLIRAVLSVLRIFENTAKGSLPGFQLPDSLQRPDALALSAIILDGESLYFSLASRKGAQTFFGGVPISQRDTRAKKAPRVTIQKVSGSAGRKLIDGAVVRTEVNLTQIAKGMRIAPS